MVQTATKAAAKAKARKPLNLDVPTTTTPPATPEPRPDREGKALLGAMVPEPALHQFGLLAKTLRKKNGELLRELVNDAFRAHKLPPIA